MNTDLAFMPTTCKLCRGLGTISSVVENIQCPRCCGYGSEAVARALDGLKRPRTPGFAPVVASGRVIGDTPAFEAESDIEWARR